MMHLRETLTMPASFYQDITDTVPDAKKASMNEAISRELSKAKHGKSKMLESVSNDKVMSVLKEAKYQDSIVERVVAKLREGGVDVGKQRIYRVPVARINPPGTLNGNHRRYPAALWENVMTNQESAWKGLCGLADHPTDDSDPGSFKNSSIVWLGMEIDKPNNLVYGIGSFVGPYGHLAQEIIDAGGRVGFSSSGFGELESDGETVNPDTYQIERLADVVLNPSQSVYGVINDETSLGNIEYTKKTVVKESVENNENRIQENTNMDTRETGVKSALSKIEEKELRKHINNYLKENVEITNPIKQLADLKEIQSLIQEGQLTDLEDTVTEKLAEAQKRIEEMVEYGLKMKEAEVSVEAGAPVDTKVEVAADGAVEVKVGDTPVVEVPATPIAEPVSTEPVVVGPETEEEATPDVNVEPEVDAPVAGDTDAIIDGAAEEVGEEGLGEDDGLLESTLTPRASKALHEYVENFLNTDHSAESPLKVIEESNEILALVKDGKLADMEEAVTTRIADLQKQLNEDIENTHQMKLDLQASSVTEINESAKSIMKSGKLLIEQVADYKELCEAITKRNQQLMNEYNTLKAKLMLAEATADSKRLTRNEQIVALSENVKTLKESYDALDEKAGEKVVELQESLAKVSKELESYKEGNAKLEKANGILKTQLKEANAKADAAADELENLKESTRKELDSNKKKLNESMVAGCGAMSVEEYKAMKEENEALKAALATFKEKKEEPTPATALDMTKLDESAQREIKILRREVSSLKSRLGEGVDNYVKTMENNVVSYYNDLEARYGEAIKPYKSSFLNARSLREAQRMFLNVARELENAGQLDESTTYVPTEGKTSDFYEGNAQSSIDATAASLGLM